MLSEAECPRDQRYLPLLCKVAEAMLPTPEKLVQYPRILAAEAAKSFFRRRAGRNELIVFCGYANYDTQVPRKYEHLVDAEGEGERVEAIVLHALADGLYPLGTIEHGWKTVCIIQFPDGIPARLASLGQWRDRPGPCRFALCCNNDKDQVQEFLMNRYTNYQGSTE